MQEKSGCLLTTVVQKAIFVLIAAGMHNIFAYFTIFTDHRFLSLHLTDNWLKMALNILSSNNKVRRSMHLDCFSYSERNRLKLKSW